MARAYGQRLTQKEGRILPIVLSALAMISSTSRDESSLGGVSKEEGKMEPAGQLEIHSELDDLCNREASVEFWFARDLQARYGYGSWESFEKVINRAIANAQTVGIAHQDHFRQVTKMVELGSGATREVSDYMLSRYGAYLTALAADEKKKPIAYIKHYFVEQTRSQELVQQRAAEVDRLEKRQMLAASEKSLSKLFHDRGMTGKEMGITRSEGDKALFGLPTQALKKRFGVLKSRPVADFLPTVSLAAKNLASEMSQVNIEAHDLRGLSAIKREHVSNNSSVREMLEERGIKPEDLPPAEDAKRVENRLKREERDIAKHVLPPGSADWQS